MTRIVRLVGMLLLFFTATPLLAQPCDCISTGNCPVPIFDNATFQGTLDVTVNGPNDLGACPLTKVCFSITHSWVGDLSVALTSPNGTNFLLMADIDNGFGGCGNEEDNVNVCIEPGISNPLTANTEYVCNGSMAGICLLGSWTMPCGGVSDPVSGAAQAPNCDLNDFNTAGSPANGTWILTVNDVCPDDTGTLDNFELFFDCGTSVCIVCGAEGGSLNTDDVTSCFGDPSLNLNISPSYGNGEQQASAGDYTYNYAITQNGTIIAINPTPDMSFQPPGVYQVCGLSYLTLATGDVQSLIGMNMTAAQNLISGQTAAFCADFSNDCVNVVIGNLIPPTVLDTFACLGECVFLENSDGSSVEVCSSGDIVLESFLGCDSVVTVILQPIFIESTVTDTVLCPGECMEVNNVVYCPPGPFIITLESVFGCDSTVTYFVTQDSTEAVILSDSLPELNCINASVTLDGSTSRPIGAKYTWIGPGNFLSNNPSIQATVPGKYTLVVENNAVNPPCTSTAEVTVVGNLTEPGLKINGPLPVLCLGETFDLNDLEVVDTNNTSPVLTFHSGTPATVANELDSTIISPTTTTTYYILATNSGGCTDEISVEVAVIPLPVVDFSVISPICLNESSTINFNGSVNTGAIFSWNFGGGTAMPGTGPGPHSVTWPTSGTKTVSLTVTENGCTSNFSQTVNVSPPLPQPVVNCNPQTSSIEFIWSPVPGASGYNVDVTIGPLGVMTSDTSYLIEGLNSGQLTSVFIEAISGNACSNSITQISCTAQDCPPVVVTINPVANICLDGTQTNVVLEASQTGGDDSGVYTFTGPGVNPISGTFNPNNGDIGPNNILVTYEEGTCVFNASTVINVFPQPSAEFTATPNICSDDISIVSYTGNASSDADFTWDFDSGIADPGNGMGPHEVTWSNEGIYIVTLQVTENGCPSETTFQTVEVDFPLPEPQIVCDASTSYIEFSWQAIPSASSYTVNASNGMQGVMTSDTSILFDNLTPNTNICLEVIANGGGACGGSMAEACCTANNCEAVIITIEPIDDICLDGTNMPFDLVPTIVGGVGGGDLTWTGNGIVDTILGTFDPNEGSFGENIVTANYVEGNCSYTQDFSIFVYALPVASFSTDAPVCDGEAMTVTYTGPALPNLSFNWDFEGGIAVPGTGAGPHQVTWPDSGPKMVSLSVENDFGCVSEIFDAQVQVVQPLSPPAILCSSTSSSIEFTWPLVPGAADYSVAVLNGPMGVFTPPNSYSFDNLSPNEEVTIELTVIGNGTCPPITIEETCAAYDCPVPDLEILPDGASTCISNSSTIDLELVVTGISGNGTETWSGNGIIDSTNGIFDPMVAGIGQHNILVVYENGNCSYQAFTVVEVFPEPTADFSITPTICVTDEAIFTYLGNASPFADFTWNLDGGIVDPIQHTITWSTLGVHSVSLSVEQDGCTSEVFEQEVEVTAEITAPDISCSASDESVEFQWTATQGATDYEIVVLSGQNGTFTPPGTYLVDGLSYGEEVIIEVTAIGNTACDLPVVTASCTANDCPDMTIDLAPIGPLCQTAQSPVLLIATTTGGSGNGAGAWSGPGVTNDLFDPAVAGVGKHSLIYEFVENANCILLDTLKVEVLAPPIADAGPDAIHTCIEGETDVELGSSNSSSGNNISYSWQAESGAFPGDSTILNPIVSLPGIYTLTITNNELGCSSTDVVIIEASQETPFPDINLLPISCFGNNDGAIIINSVSGGQPPYMFSINGSPFSQTSAFTHLAPGIYEINIIDANNCENRLTFDIQQPQELNVELVVSIEGDNNVITLGESVTMTGVVNVPDDSLDWVQWEPAGLVSCDTCLNTIAEPVQQTTFSITVGDNGCTDSDALTIFVAKERNIYVPTGFSPNDDSLNDLFMIYANEDQVEKVKSFMVFNRWGETVYQYKNFPPNNPNFGWDGTFRGSKLSPAVFTWFAEIEFTDGSTLMLEGDVTLIK
ncbi:MAG: gliding motility-associated C-terminal domain-containing protein [Saprospiraceae bacterium]